MKHRTIAITALVLALGSALGQAPLDARFDDRAAANDLRGTTLMGATVYRADTFQTESVVDGVRDDWESVATVDDVLISQFGELRGVLLDVGGFLGIGARTVLVSMDSLQIVLERDTDMVYVLMNATREQLENAPEFDVDTISSQARSDFGGRVGVPDGQLEGYATLEVTSLTADDLEGAAVYDRFGDRVSGISDVVLTSDGGAVEAVLIDVGGFLGFFTRSVLVGIDQLDVRRAPESDAVHVYLTLSQDELANLPVHER